MLLVGIVSIGHGSRAGIALGLPLICAAGTFGHLPLVLEQVLEIVVAPLLRLGRPSHLYSTGDGIAGNAGLVGTCPAKALVFDRCALRLLIKMAPRPRTVCLSKSV